jgi:hypothetical protein
MICNVHGDDEWPPNPPRINKVSGEPYYTPDFTRDVNHPTNASILQKVARLTMHDLKVSLKLLREQVNTTSSHSEQNKTARLAALRADGVYFDRSTIVELAKTSFRGFKTKALAQSDEEKSEKLEANRKTGKRRDRRKTGS